MHGFIACFIDKIKLASLRIPQVLSLFYGVFHEEYNLSEEYSVQCKVCTVQGIVHGVQNSSFCCPYSCIACFISATDFSAHSVPDVLIRSCQSYERIFFCGGFVWLVWFGFCLFSFFLFFFCCCCLFFALTK